MYEKKACLEQIDKVIENGPYRDSWDSLSAYPLPDWFQNAKLGIFSHWGVFSVPESFSEWYPRMMYIHTNPVYWHKVKTYGRDFQYRQMIALFQGEKFDAAAWIKLIQAVGADYYVPVAEHHDGFKLYQSSLSEWNSVCMGPKRDILGELKAAAEKEGLVFCASNHRAEHYWFMNGMRTLSPKSKAEMEAYPEFYGPCYNKFSKNTILNAVDIGSGKFDKIVPTEAWREDWLIHVCELIDLYEPQLLYFDWWIHNAAWRPYVKKMMAYYYNRSLVWGKQVTVAAKRDSMMTDCGVYDRERGRLSEIPERKWQCDTSTSRNSWSYCKTNRWKTPLELASTFLDVLSKNGALLLNICPRADGSFCSEEQELLSKFGAWNRLHRDILWNSKPFRVYGEGKHRKTGTMQENDRFTSADYRFLYRRSHLYAFCLRPVRSGKYLLKTAGSGNSDAFGFIVKQVSLVNGEPVEFVQNEKGLAMRVQAKVDLTMPLCFDILMD